MVGMVRADSCLWTLRMVICSLRHQMLRGLCWGL